MYNVKSWIGFLSFTFPKPAIPDGAGQSHNDDDEVGDENDDEDDDDDDGDDNGNDANEANDDDDWIQNQKDFTQSSSNETGSGPGAD